MGSVFQDVRYAWRQLHISPCAGVFHSAENVADRDRNRNRNPHGLGSYAGFRRAHGCHGGPVARGNCRGRSAPAVAAVWDAIAQPTLWNSSSDPLSLAMATLLIVLVAISAASLAARSAARVGPTVALRYE
jgi:hypothetical protein